MLSLSGASFLEQGMTEFRSTRDVGKRKSVRHEEPSCTKYTLSRLGHRTKPLWNFQNAEAELDPFHQRLSGRSGHEVNAARDWMLMTSISCCTVTLVPLSV